MADGGPDDFHERFLKANANLDFIAGQFADVIRHLLRAVGSERPSEEAYRAAEKMNFVAELLLRTDEGLGFHHLFREALREFETMDRGHGDVDAAMLHAARRCLKYLAERSSVDNAARGRASRRGDEFLAAIEDIDDARQAMRSGQGRQ
jgi:hypothetical protein